jgi:hypothetical protein
VRVRLAYRRIDGLYSAGSEWSSNSSNVTGNTVAYKNNAHDVRSDAVYSFVVRLTRTNSTESPAFSGIDFPILPEG